jgi:hypothetical protein
MKMKFLPQLIIFLSCIHLTSQAQDNRIWATYMGGPGNDGGFSVSTDPSGNIFMAGITMSATGISAGGFQNSFGGGVVDAYLLKCDSAGNRMWSTYFGGAGDEMAFFGGKMGVAADGEGNVFLAGFTSSDTGISQNGFQNSRGGTSVNGYLAKFNSIGYKLWATYYGGTDADKFYSVATDHDGNVYAAGIGYSQNLASGGFQNNNNGGSDALLVKFDPNGNRIWATYFGGAGSDEGYTVTVDDSFNVYIAGTTTSTGNIAASGYQNFYGGGGSDAFLVKFDSSGARIWSTYIGGSGDEMELFAGDIGVAADHAGNVYLAGLTSSTTGISSNGFQNLYGGGSSDAFLVKFDPVGAMLWSTYYGGSDLDKGYSVSVDHVGDVFLAGRTDSYNAISSGGFQNNNNGPHEMFLAKFDPQGNRICATFFGGTDVDECNSVAADDFGGVYIGGNTTNTVGIAWSGFQNSLGGGTSDAFLVKFTSCASTTEVNEFHSSEALTYPNPSEGKIKLLPAGIKGDLNIYDVTGNLIYHTVMTGYEKSIDLSSYPDEIYCAVFSNGIISRTEKIIIE